MKDLKKSLSKIAGDLMRVAQQAETLAAKLEAPEKPKQAAPKAPRKQSTTQPTAADAVYKVIARYKKGADVDRIKQKTGYDTKKIHNLVYKLKKQNKIKSETKGVYMKV